MHLQGAWHFTYAMSTKPLSAELTTAVSQKFGMGKTAVEIALNAVTKLHGNYQ